MEVPLANKERLLIMPVGIDYSKWDKMNFDSEDDQDNDDGDGDGTDQSRPGPPRVTRLDKPSLITTNKDGDIVITQQQQQQQQQPDDTSVVPSANATIATSATPSAWTERGATDTIHGRRIYWSQDRYSVTVRIELPNDEPNANKAKWTCVASNILSYQDRFTATAIDSDHHKPHIAIVNQTDGRRLIESHIPYPVYFAEDDDGVLDWSIESDSTQPKFMVITLNKASPMQGLTLWWKRPLAICQESKLEWRRQEQDGGVDAFSAAWKEAHEQFRRKRQKDEAD